MSKVWFVTATVTLIFALAACGGSADNPPQGSEGTQNPTPTASPASASPEDLADEVAQNYFDALDSAGTLSDQLVVSLDEGSPLDDLRQEVQRLKDEYIAIFVSYGYERESMSESERATFDSTVNSAIVLSTPPALDRLSAAVASLNEAGERDLANELSSFNILTQYAFFDLLKRQEPDEAQRLGIP